MASEPVRTETPIDNTLARLFKIEEFYTALALHLFGGERNPCQNGDGDHTDIFHWQWEVGFEVKGASNMNPVKVFEDQLDWYLENRGFPLKDFWYVVFHYRNKPRAIVRDTPTVESLYGFLTERTFCLSLIDVRVLEALRRINGAVPERRYNYMGSMVRVGRYLLRRIAKDPEQIQAWLKLNSRFRAKSFDCRTVFRGRVMRFRVLQFLPWGHHRRVVHQLKRRCAVHPIQPPTAR